MLPHMVLSQIITRDLEAGVKIHLQSSRNLFQHNREQHNINPLYLIGLNWRPCHIAWKEFVGVRYGLFSLSETLLIHHYQEAIEFALSTWMSMWSTDKLTGRHCGVHGRSDEPKDNAGHIANHSQSRTSAAVSGYSHPPCHLTYAGRRKDQGQENWNLGQRNLGTAHHRRVVPTGYFWTNWQLAGWGEHHQEHHTASVCDKHIQIL